jgi:2,3-bisphosphoglycerate-independent phosphoglycerate mutase
MKSIMIILEAAADEPVGQLDGRTPLSLARLHVAGRWARAGRCGVVESLPEMPFWRPEAMLATFAGVPSQRALGWRRGPLEALTMTRPLPSKASVVYRVDFVTVDEGKVRDAGPVRLEVEETDALVSALQRRWEERDWMWRVTGPGTAVVGLEAGDDALWEGMSPQWFEGMDAGENWGTLSMPESLREMLREASVILSCHPVNEVRVDLGENPANGIWLWGGGRRMERVGEHGPVAGVMVTDSLLGRGVAAACGMRSLPLRSPYTSEIAPLPFHVPELVAALRETKLLMAYVSAPVRGGRHGTGRDKVRFLDHVDQRVLRPLSEVLEAYRPYRLMLAADSVVSSETGRPRPGVIPVVLYGDGIDPDEVACWNEEACSQGSLGSMKLRDFWERMALAENAPG